MHARPVEYRLPTLQQPRDDDWCKSELTSNKYLYQDHTLLTGSNACPGKRQNLQYRKSTVRLYKLNMSIFILTTGNLKATVYRFARHQDSPC